MSEMEKCKFYLPIIVHVNRNGEPFNSINELEETESVCYEKQIRDSFTEYFKDVSGELLALHLNSFTGTDAENVYVEAEAHNHELFGVVTIEVGSNFDETVMDSINYWITNEFATEWLADFEERVIKVEEGEIYVSFFNSYNELTIQTEEEFFGQQHGGMQMS